MQEKNLDEVQQKLFKAYRVARKAVFKTSLHPDCPMQSHIYFTSMCTNYTPSDIIIKIIRSIMQISSLDQDQLLT